MLYFRHSMGTSVRTLHRILRTKGLYRRRFPSPLLDDITFIENEIGSSGCSIGYWEMHQRYIRNSYKVSK